jgi:uncharacterized membrane protein (UPF0182 family)
VRRRRRGALIPTLVVLGVLVVLGLIVAGVWTDVLWYSQLGFVSVYWTQLITQLLLFLLGALLMAGAVLACLMLAYRSRPVYVPVAGDPSGIERYREAIEPLRRLVVLAVPTVLGLFAGSAFSQQWQTVLLWWNGVDFGRDDPQFGLDIGFFVFTLPFLEFLVGFFTAIVVLAALASVVAHYLYGGIRLQGPGQRFTPAARIHLSVLAAAFLLLRGVDYWLGRYDLATVDSERITGLTYTDAHATLTAKSILAGIAIIVAVLFLVGAFVEGSWRMLPLYGVVLLLVCAIVIGGIYPAIVQRFQVTPNASTLEAPYIKRNIDATRAAYGLSDIQVQRQYSGQATSSAQAAEAAKGTGIRLIDPSIVSETFKQLEQIRPFYTFPDSLDVDRYTIDGKTQDSVVAVRELNLNGLGADQRNWVNDHIVYTHGFGIVAAYGDQQDPSGVPLFYERNIPPAGSLNISQPRIYFGENSPDYSIVGGPGNQELDFSNESTVGQQNTSYNGGGGVSIGSALNRLLYAIKFREQNILLSSAVNSQSRILYDRSPRERVEKVAPYLTLDGDPYPSVVDGKLVWIIDGFTTTSQYPYSRTISLRDVTSDSVTENSRSVAALEQQDVNYIRNSVKATVDAFTGAVTLYAWDEQDPLLRAWMNIFPGTVKPLADMDGELMSHVRYPEDLFKVQRTLLARYHVTDAGAFFGGQDFWQIPADPTDNAGSDAPGLQPAYYLTLQMPNQAAPAFSLTSTFIPRSSGATTRNVLTGFLAVDSDAGAKPGVKQPGYGTLRLLQLPKDTTVPAPGQVQNNFNSNPDVSNQLNILRGGQGGSGGSRVQNGNLLTLPLANGLLYVQPVYLRGSSQSSYPLLQRVLVEFGNQIGYAATLNCALDQVFNKRQTGSTDSPACAQDARQNVGGTTSPPGGGTSNPSTSPSTSPTTPSTAPSGSTGNPQQQLATALSDANKALQDSQNALQKGDFAAYGQAQDRLKAAIARALAAEQRLGTGSATPSASPSPTK